MTEILPSHLESMKNHKVYNQTHFCLTTRLICEKKIKLDFKGIIFLPF